MQRREYSIMAELFISNFCEEMEHMKLKRPSIRLDFLSFAKFIVFTFILKCIYIHFKVVLSIFLAQKVHSLTRVTMCANINS